MTLLRALILTAALSAPATASGPIKVFLDGQYIGTHDGIEYNIGAGEVHIKTNEIVYGCKQDRIFRDRFDQE